MIALAKVGSPVTYVLYAVLFEQLGRVVGESSIDRGQSTRQTFVDAEFLEYGNSSHQLKSMPV